LRFFSLFFFVIPRGEFRLLVPWRNRRTVVLPILQRTILSVAVVAGVVVALEFREGHAPQAERDRPGQGVHAEVLQRRESRRRSPQLVRGGTIRQEAPPGNRRYRRPRELGGGGGGGHGDRSSADAPRLRIEPIRGRSAGRMARKPSALPRSKGRCRRRRRRGTRSIPRRARLVVSASCRGCCAGYSSAVENSRAVAGSKPKLSERCHSGHFIVVGATGRWTPSRFSEVAGLDFFNSAKELAILAVVMEQ